MKDIDGYIGEYAITEDGKVWSYKNKRFLKTQLRNGYELVQLCQEGVVKGYLVHRLVAMAYIPNPDNLPEVGHLDEIRNHNEVSNLYWTTHIDNINYGQHNALIAKANGKRVYCVELNTWYDSQSQASRELGLKQANISAAIKRNGTCGGYHWQFAVD